MTERCLNCGALEHALQTAEENERRLRAENDRLKQEVGRLRALVAGAQGLRPTTREANPASVTHRWRSEVRKSNPPKE